MSDPHGFQKFDRVDPPKRAVKDRILDWNDFYQELPEKELKNQAARCMDCGVPFCQSHTGCPVENRIPEWNELVAAGRWQEALHSLHSTNNFPEFTGKLCPAPCESACVLALDRDPVSIRNIEWSIIERGFAEKIIEPIRAKSVSGKSIAIVGSGPAGLAAAQQLVRAGHRVVVYEKSDSIGGLLRYGIPDFKMEKSVLDRRLKQLASEGVEFRTGIEIGRHITLTELREDYHAVALTIGAERPRDLSIPGRDLPGVHFAMDYLTSQNRMNAGKDADKDTENLQIHACGKRVLIIGAGDTASDCLGTVHRQECQEVHQFALMSEPDAKRSVDTPWPMWPKMLRSSHAHEEGGNRNFSISTTALVGDSNGVRAVRGLRLDTGAEFELPVDLVLIAIGFQGARANFAKNSGLALSARETIVVGNDFQTNLPGVFASGDATRGASLIVWAIAEARKMAASIDQLLTINNLSHIKEKGMTT